MQTVHPIEVWLVPHDGRPRRAILRRIIGPHRLVITKRPSYRMQLVKKDHSKLFANISHSRNQQIIAFSTQPIGVDIESTNRQVSSEAILDQYFSVKELAAYHKIRSPREQRRYFLKLWTQKEALLKMAGAGLAHGLARFTIAHPGKKMRISGTLPNILRGKTLYLQTYDFQKAWFVSVAFVAESKRKSHRTRFWKLSKNLRNQRPLSGIRLLMSCRHQVAGN